jgi:Collagen triple helix repeat (20 copies)
MHTRILALITGHKAVTAVGGIALAGALAIGGNAAYGAVASSGPVSSSGVVTACYTNAEINGSHVVVLQDAGTTCPKGTTAITWNQTGPAGATGPAGPTGPAGLAGPIGAAGAVGAPGPTGPAGQAGPIGNTGPAGPQGPPGTNGNTVLNGTGAPASTVGNDGDFYVDTAADVLYGPKANGTWPATGTGLVGSPGSTGPAGPAGPQGPAGPAGISSVTDFNGITCTTAGGTDGAVTANTASNNTVTLTCNGLSTDPNCTHSDGEGQNYTDCNDLLGDPTSGTGYNQSMATDAAQAYPGVQFAGIVTTSCSGGITGSAAEEIASQSGTLERVFLWQYSGPNTGSVHMEDINTSSPIPFACPTSSDPTWN